MDDGIENVCSKMDSVEGSPILMKLCDVVCLDLPEPEENIQGNVKKEEGNGKCCVLFTHMSFY